MCFILIICLGVEGVQIKYSHCSEIQSEHFASSVMHRLESCRVAVTKKFEMREREKQI